MNGATLLRPIPVYGGVSLPDPPRETLPGQIFQPWRTDTNPGKILPSQMPTMSLQEQLNHQEFLRRRLQLFSLTNLWSVLDWKGLAHPDRKSDTSPSDSVVNLSNYISDGGKRTPHPGTSCPTQMIFPNKTDQLPNQFVAGRKVFPCPQCRYTTDRRNNLKRHMLTMHQTCPKLLECCGILFSTKASLREHAMIFHYHGYHCYYCGRRFCRKALLKRHLSVHSGQKDFTCPICDYATSHKSNLERHRKVHFRQPSDVDCETDHVSECGSGKDHDADVCVTSDDEIDVSSD